MSLDICNYDVLFIFCRKERQRNKPTEVEASQPSIVCDVPLGLNEAILNLISHPERPRLLKDQSKSVPPD